MDGEDNAPAAHSRGAFALQAFERLGNARVKRVDCEVVESFEQAGIRRPIDAIENLDGGGLKENAVVQTPRVRRYSSSVT